MKEETIYIVDGHAVIYRAYHTPVPESEFTSPDGKPTKTAFLFCRMLLSYISKLQCERVVMTVDSPHSGLFRKQIYPNYKMHSDTPPDDFLEQVQLVYELINVLGIPMLRHPRFEADDLIASCARQASLNGCKVVIIGSDKDLYQLVTDRVTMYDPVRDQHIGVKEILDRKGVLPKEYLEVQVLTGDDTDNVPGIYGVGEVTATKLIKKYGTAENAVRHADEQTPKLRERLEGAIRTIGLSRALVTLINDVEIDVTLPDSPPLALSDEWRARVRNEFKRLGFDSLIGWVEATRLGAHRG